MTGIEKKTGLSTLPLVGFVPISDKDQALAFYRDRLGLTLLEDQSPFALVFDAAGIMVRATFAGEFKPQPFTVLGWQVDEIETTVHQLVSAGVVRMDVDLTGEHVRQIHSQGAIHSYVTNATRMMVMGNRLHGDATDPP